MAKEKYQVEYERLHEERGYRYTIVGSPTHLRLIATAQADTYKDLWLELARQEELDIVSYVYDHEVYDPHREVYFVPEPDNELEYKELIEKYLRTSGNYYYNQNNI